MDEDNTDVEECYYEEIVEPTDEKQKSYLADKSKVLVWISNKM